MRDLISNLSAAIAIPAAELDADNTPAAIDVSGFDGVMIEIHVGVGGITFTTNNRIEFKLTHASAADGDFTAVTAADVQGVSSVGEGGIVHSLVAAHGTPRIARIGYVGGRAFLKLLADFSGTHSEPTPIAASVILGHPRRAPVAA